MKRRDFLRTGAAGSALIGAGTASEAQAACQKPGKIETIANDSVIVYESPDPERVYAYSPGLCRTPQGCLVATMERGGKGIKERPEIEESSDGHLMTGMIFTSDDHGQSWQHRSDMPLKHARPFVAGDSLYILGHCGDLGIMRSDDWGETWGDAAWLTKDQSWHQAPCNVHYTRGRVYLVMERNTDLDYDGWPVGVLAPVVMAANVDADLTQRDSWTFSSELSYRDAIEKTGKPHQIGVPFFERGATAPGNPEDKRYMAMPGWLETNVVQFTDPDHVWHDPTGRTFHLWMRSHTGTSNLAAIAKAVEGEDGEIEVSLEKAPTGEPMLFVPCPGGQLKFHILHDERDGLFWLVSNQSTDSMTRPERLPNDRYNLPNNERHRLVLHFSKNCVDWCFAGRVADTGDPAQARNYASMVIDGEDLHVLARSGDERVRKGPRASHDGNLITFHTVPGFRELAY
jgi:hypothetical protein